MGHQTTELEPVIKYIKAGWDLASGEDTMKLEAPCSDTGSEALQTDDFE